jgi:hypothetical protein
LSLRIKDFNTAVLGSTALKAARIMRADLSPQDWVLVDWVIKRDNSIDPRLSYSEVFTLFSIFDHNLMNKLH